MIDEGNKTPTVIFVVLAGIVGLGCLFGGLFFFFGIGFPSHAPPVPVTLPAAKVAPAALVTVALLSDGSVRVDGAPVADAELEATLAGRHVAGDERVVIAADPAVSHGRVVQVMDAAKAAGFTKLALAVAAADAGM